MVFEADARAAESGSGGLTGLCSRTSRAQQHDAESHHHTAVQRRA